ncbi:Glyoxalase/bleomycin resistance protein/dioxygenase [Candidatus Koribacter versatilis Ellin345]|uniref:Glyoxalase/bleomycin resistance protein/dioxygenase n=1 Tax=Koribacter versatilis (strain Ellin345) TaxID=204669 RepID=Q1II44_KORVE|nr:VOC family protein [Candidatus Koribacter versatilis]ABF43456.1 Glyoxalase/bleomycin resistance protein/dioxygenase [Candidatus Koribacter versatilis Ellin345]
MKAINVYLVFDGNCGEAMEYYHKALGGEIFKMKFSDAPGGAPPGAGDRYVHIAIKNGNVLLMASDNMPGMPFTQGTNYSVCISCDSNDEVDKLFKHLSVGGHVHMPPGEQFWAHRFAGFTDKFGINWMLNHEKPMQG